MEPQDEHQGAVEVAGLPKRTGRFWFDLFAATTAVFVSVVSLFVAMRGEETQPGLLAANSWPFIQLSENRNLDVAMFDVENAGVGPAKIMSFEVFYKGHPVDSAYDLLSRCCSAPAKAPGPAENSHGVRCTGMFCARGNTSFRWS